MGNTWDDDDTNTDDGKGGDENSPKALRAHAKKVADDLAEAKKQIAELMAEKRSGNIEKLVTERKLPAKVAKLVPSDVDPTSEAIGKWLDEYADVFGSGKNEGQSEDGPEDDLDDEIDEDAAAFQRIGRAASSAVGTRKQSEMLAKLKNASKADILGMIAAAGGGVG